MPPQLVPAVELQPRNCLCDLFRPSFYDPLFVVAFFAFFVFVLQFPHFVCPHLPTDDLTNTLPRLFVSQQPDVFDQFVQVEFEPPHAANATFDASECCEPQLWGGGSRGALRKA
jgi:hypothetical protein